jgi:hypothetical protein
LPLRDWDKRTRGNRIRVDGNKARNDSSGIPLKPFFGLSGIRWPQRTEHEHAQNREGDFSCETSPSRFRFSEIRFWFLITTLAIFGIVRRPRATARALTSLFYDHTRCKSFPTAVRFQLPGPSLVTDSRRPLLVRSLLLEDHSSAETNTTLHQWKC